LKKRSEVILEDPGSRKEVKMKKVTIERVEVPEWKKL
jgi:hypothetical protein